MRTGTDVNFHYVPSKEFPYFYSSPCVKTDPADGQVKYDSFGKHHVRFFESTGERDIEQKKYEAEHNIRCHAGQCNFD